MRGIECTKSCHQSHSDDSNEIQQQLKCWISILLLACDSAGETSMLGEEIECKYSAANDFPMVSW